MRRPPGVGGPTSLREHELLGHARAAGRKANEVDAAAGLSSSVRSSIPHERMIAGANAPRLQPAYDPAVHAYDFDQRLKIVADSITDLDRPCRRHPRREKRHFARDDPAVHCDGAGEE